MAKILVYSQGNNVLSIAVLSLPTSPIRSISLTVSDLADLIELFGCDVSRLAEFKKLRIDRYGGAQRF